MTSRSTRPHIAPSLVAVLVVCAVAAGAAAVAAVVFIARRDIDAPSVAQGDQPRTPLAPGVTARRIDAPATHWRAHGFVEMVPPVRLPSDRAGRDAIRVWLKVGEGKITAKTLVDGRVVLAYPPGTVADRVESMGDAVIDVRGTTLRGTTLRGAMATGEASAGEELFHVYVAESEAPSALVGWEWRRGDFAAEASATAALLAQLDRTKRTLRGEPPPTAQQHANSLRSYERNNNCGGCHAHEKPPVARGDTVHRATDAAGFFVPQSVLADVLPLERHRPWDVNVGDPYLAISCPTGSTPQLLERGDARQLTCASFEIPVARLDVRRALAAGDERTVAMCRSRRYLFDHMDEKARAAFADAFEACGINETNG
jgi:hypothetical protein